MGIAHCSRASLQGERLGQLGFACPTTNIHFVSGVVAILVSLIGIMVGGNPINFVCHVCLIVEVLWHLNERP